MKTEDGIYLFHRVIGIDKETILSGNTPKYFLRKRGHERQCAALIKLGYMADDGEKTTYTDIGLLLAKLLLL